MNKFKKFCPNVRYREDNGITYKEVYEQVGWGLLDATPLYKVDVTAFTIADGIISRSYRYANKDGSNYALTSYRNLWNGFSTI